ncbi:hypothetical protein F5884DRAFT_763182 [Xylogone sp. PMI_703]|nr:hypothetical protein F5884DRAFT_763182 [Xylogone sp. PMI_703]
MSYVGMTLYFMLLNPVMLLTIYVHHICINPRRLLVFSLRRMSRYFQHIVKLGLAVRSVLPSLTGSVLRQFRYSSISFSASHNCM